MTQLDEARAEACVKEAGAKYAARPEVFITDGARLWIARKAIELYAEGWQPTPPVDPDLVAAREIVLSLADIIWPGDDDMKQRVSNGDCDTGVLLKTALAAFKAGAGR